MPRAAPSVADQVVTASLPRLDAGAVLGQVRRLGGDGYLRSRLCVPFDLHECGLGRRALTEAGGAGVAGEHVRVAVDLERVRLAASARCRRLVPGARGEMDDATAERVTEYRTGQARSEERRVGEEGRARRPRSA